MPSFTPVGNPAPPIPTTPAAFTISSLLPSSIGTNSSFCSSSGLIMILSSVTSTTSPYALEKILAPSPVGVAIRVPFSTLSPAFTIASQGAPTCCLSRICKFPMTIFSFIFYFYISKSRVPSAHLFIVIGFFYISDLFFCWSFF